MNTFNHIFGKLGLITLGFVVATSAGCRKKKSSDDSSDIEGLGSIPVVVTGNQPVTGNGKVTVGGTGTPVLTDSDDSAVPNPDGSSAGALVELAAEQKAHTETAVKAQKIADVGTHPTLLWSKVSGPGNVTFADPTVASTNVSADADGVYVLRLTATYADGRSGSDDITFSWDKIGRAHV